ncbi:hypothetical protein SPFL3102_03557 [Sporomusaceae bacterium FL31]|nr:hypothetical protein SPFL3101_00448 [Sporomusaceae bacterium FL31]GCE35706.1 hypothetical protein SPFL3102_03557 [Sporomusaceae bacterium]
MSNDKFVTPSGEVFWAHLRSEELYNGQPTGRKSIMLKLPLEQTEELLKKHEAIYNELKKYSPCFKGVKPAKGSKPNFGTKTNADGDTLFKFSTKAIGENKKTGEKWEKVIPVFDGAGKHIEVNLGNGSTAHVSYEIGPKFVSGTNYGLNLYLLAVKVKNLVQYAPGAVSAESFGFDVDPEAETEFDETFNDEANDDSSGEPSDDF